MTLHRSHCCFVCLLFLVLFLPVNKTKIHFCILSPFAYSRKAPFGLFHVRPYVSTITPPSAHPLDGFPWNLVLVTYENQNPNVVQKGKWSLYRPCVAQRVGRGIALLFHDRGTRRGVSGQQHAPAALYPRERPGTHFTGGWVGPRDGLDGRKISSPPEFDPGPSSP